MEKERRKLSPVFKTKVVLEAFKDVSVLEELASKCSLHPTQITTWKREFGLSNFNVICKLRDCWVSRKEVNHVILLKQGLLKTLKRVSVN